MAGQAIWTYATAVSLETDGAATIANAAFVSGPDASLTSGNHLNYPLCDVTLTVTGFGSALAGFQIIALHRRDMDVGGGTQDAVAPAAASPFTYVGTFQMVQSQATNTAGTFHLTDVPLSESCYFYLENKTGQAVNTSWGLTVRPKTMIASA